LNTNEKSLINSFYTVINEIIVILVIVVVA